MTQPAAQVANVGNVGAQAPACAEVSRERVPWTFHEDGQKEDAQSPRFGRGKFPFRNVCRGEEDEGFRLSRPFGRERID